MKGAIERGHLAIGLGDFNMVPLSLAHRLITSYANVMDAWRVLHPNSSLGAANGEAEKQRKLPVPTAGFNLSENGTTCDSVLNTWRWSKERSRALRRGQDVQVPDTETDPRAKRLDYVFVGNAEQDPHTTAPRPSWQIETVKVTMTERHPTLRCSLSDHFAVQAIMARKSPTSYRQITLAHKDGIEADALPDAPKEEHSATIETHRFSTLPYSDILPMIAKYTLRERKQRRWRMCHFFGSVLVSIGCFVAIWWSPHNYVAFILNLISTLGLGAGVIDGLIGGLFVGSELRALKEFEWEVRNASQQSGAEKHEETLLKDWFD